MVQRSRQPSKSVRINTAANISHRSVTGYASRDAELLKQAAERHRQAATKPPPDFARAASVFLGALAMLMALTTTVSSRWTRGSVAFPSQTDPTANDTNAAPATTSNSTAQSTTAIVGVWNNYVEYAAEVGMWESCNCTEFTAEGVTAGCSTRISKARALQAFGILTTIFEFFGLASFIALSFLTLSKKVEYGCAVTYGAAALFALLSWILAIVLYTDTSCGGFSFQQAGMRLHWAFAFRVIESFLLTGLAGLNYMRAAGKATMWHVALVVSIITWVITIATTANNLWMGAKNIDNTNSDATVSAGPWGICACTSILSACGDVSGQFRSMQAFSVLQTIAHVAQFIFICFVPAYLPQVPEVAVVGFSWGTWCFQLILWSIAAATFSDCRCEPLVTQQFGWPFAILFLSFLVQSGISSHLSFQLGKKRVMAWVLERTGGVGGVGSAVVDTAAAANQMVNPVAQHHIQNGASDPFAGGSPGSPDGGQGFYSLSPSPPLSPTEEYYQREYTSNAQDRGLHGVRSGGEHTAYDPYDNDNVLTPQRERGAKPVHSASPMPQVPPAAGGMAPVVSVRRPPPQGQGQPQPQEPDAGVPPPLAFPTSVSPQQDGRNALHRL